MGPDLVFGLTPKVVALLREYKSGKIGTKDFVDRLAALRIQELQSLQV